jgi:hypothetical protein
MGIAGRHESLGRPGDCGPGSSRNLDVWVVFGWLVARNRPLLRWFHFGSLIYGIFIEIAPWPCPLTLLEQWLESKAGVAVYRAPFLVHYLEALVYPDVPERVLVSVAVAVCMVNLYLHAKRFLRR